ncbi:uncharacterized protein LOC123294034 isoform X2 [Chrysoperla carnea]|nr:uncharacterized protein LOC123294034 isoform X2 [Chrysoperla carnea]
MGLKHIIFVTIVTCCYLQQYNCQSNYASQANNIEYQGNGLPEQTILDGKVTKLDDLSPVIFLNRTKAALNCAAGSMQVELKFNDKFYGIAYADFDRNSACRVSGSGDISYKLELPLKGCGTRQDPQRVFTNNIVVRFHPGLEMDGDEVITIVCRYPPPVAPIPAPLPIREDLVPAPILEPPLNGLQILLIICAILFLSLVLLGLGVSYYCLRRRHLTVVRRHPFSVGSGSEITKLSGSSLGNISMFEGLKIPRAQCPGTATASSSGSEGPLISDTLPSDYPSESHSEIEDVDTRSLPVSSAGSFENKGYVQETSSFYSDSYGHTQEVQSALATATIVPRLPLAVKDQPKFDIQVRVKRAPPSPPSIASTSDTESSVARTERNLTTILEQREDTSTVRTVDTQNKSTHFTYVPEIHPVPKYIQQPPVYSRILRRQQELQESSEYREAPPVPEWDEIDQPPRLQSARSMTSLNTEMTDTHSMTEIIDSSHNKFVAPAPPPPPPIVPTKHYESTIEMERHEILQEPPITAYRQPEITSHTVDDVFLKTITEKRTIEDIEKHKRLITEYYTRAKPQIQEPERKWDVTIRNIPTEGQDAPDWENFSDISSASNLTLTPKPERAQISLPPQSFVTDKDIHLFSPELVASTQSPPTAERIIPETYISTLEIPIVNEEVPNWNVLIRVIKPEDDPQEEALVNQLTMADKVKWRQIITTESTLRTLLSEAVVREDFERIRFDQRYERLFEPPKWDVIIRILSPPERPKNSNRYRKKSDWDSRSRRSSLPTLYEYDSDGGSSIRTLTNEPPVHSGYIPRTRRSSRSSYRSEADLRSMSEVMVDFARPEHIDNQSEASSYYHPSRYYEDSEPDNDYLRRSSSQPSLVRSLSQPSLARSASEFTERWIAPVRYDTASEFTSPETTPKSQRSTRMQQVLSSRYPSGDDQIHAMERSWQQASSSRQLSSQPRGGDVLTSSQVVREEYINETTSFQSKSGGWFGDNNSDTRFK